MWNFWTKSLVVILLFMVIDKKVGIVSKISDMIPGK